MKKTMGYVYVILASVFWGAIGLFNRTLQSCGVGLMTRQTVRQFGAFLALLVIFGLFRRSVFRIQWKHLPLFAVLGIVSQLGTSWLYMSCQMECSLAVACTLMYLSPALVVLFDAVVRKKPLTKRKVTAVLLSLVGSALVSGIVSGGLTISLKGLIVGVLSAVTYAGYTILGQYILKTYDSQTMLFWGMTFSGFASLLLADGAEVGVVFRNPLALLAAAGLALICSVAAYFCYAKSLEVLDGGTASVISTLEAVVAVLIGLLVFHEVPDGWTLVGIAMVISSVILLSRGDKK